MSTMNRIKAFSKFKRPCKIDIGSGCFSFLGFPFSISFFCPYIAAAWLLYRGAPITISITAYERISAVAEPWCWSGALPKDEENTMKGQLGK